MKQEGNQEQDVLNVISVYLTLLKFVPGVEGNLKKVIPYAQQVKEMEVKIPGDWRQAYTQLPLKYKHNHEDWMLMDNSCQIKWIRLHNTDNTVRTIGITG